MAKIRIGDVIKKKLLPLLLAYSYKSLLHTKKHANTSLLQDVGTGEEIEGDLAILGRGYPSSPPSSSSPSPPLLGLSDFHCIANKHNLSQFERIYICKDANH